MIDEDKIEKAAKEYAEKNKTLIKNTTSIKLSSQESRVVL